MKIKNKIIEFVKKETVLTAAMVLAVLVGGNDPAGHRIYRIY